MGVAKEKHVAQAKFRNCPISPRKVALVADMIRGKRVSIALDLLMFSDKSSSVCLRKLLLSAVSGWRLKNEDSDASDDLFVKEITVGGGTMLKRLQTAPQGRAHRIRKRSSHVTIFLGN